MKPPTSHPTCSSNTASWISLAFSIVLNDKQNASRLAFFLPSCRWRSSPVSAFKRAPTIPPQIDLNSHPSAVYTLSDVALERINGLEAFLFSHRIFEPLFKSSSPVFSAKSSADVKGSQTIWLGVNGRILFFAEHKGDCVVTMPQVIPCRNLRESTLHLTSQHAR